MGTKIQIGGMPFEIEKVDTELEVCHTGSGQKLWGQINYSKHSIRVLKACPERELRSTIHEILHGIINEYRVRELMDDKGEHFESPIDQLALGLAEVLESVGITELKPNVRSQATDAALSRQVACTDGLGVAVPPAPTFEQGD